MPDEHDEHTVPCKLGLTECKRTRPTDILKWARVKQPRMFPHLRPRGAKSLTNGRKPVELPNDDIPDLGGSDDRCERARRLGPRSIQTLDACVCFAADLSETVGGVDELSDGRKAELLADIETLGHWARASLTPELVWHEADSNVPGHLQYFDDERGPEESRYVIVPVKTKGGRFSRYAVTEDGRLIDEVKDADEAKWKAREHAANNPPDRE